MDIQIGFDLRPRLAQDAKDRARQRVASKHAAEIEALVPLMQELALKAGPHGVIVGDLRIVAVQRKMLIETGGRALSWLCAVPKAAGLIPTNQRRLCPIPATRNDQVIHIHPAYARSVA